MCFFLKGVYISSHLTHPPIFWMSHHLDHAHPPHTHSTHPLHRGYIAARSKSLLAALDSLSVVFGSFWSASTRKRPKGRPFSLVRAPVSTSKPRAGQTRQVQRMDGRNTTEPAADASNILQSANLQNPSPGSVLAPSSLVAMPGAPFVASLLLVASWSSHTGLDPSPPSTYMVGPPTGPCDARGAVAAGARTQTFQGHLPLTFLGVGPVAHTRQSGSWMVHLHPLSPPLSTS